MNGGTVAVALIDGNINLGLFDQIKLAFREIGELGFRGPVERMPVNLRKGVLVIQIGRPPLEAHMKKS